MLTRLRKILSRTPPLTAPLATGGVISVVGDVHGCVRQLRDLLPQCAGQIVLVGDLIDRGDGSAAVIDLVMSRPDIICLMGNHESMLLDFLENPVEVGPRWLRYGGLQTIASFGVRGDLSAAGLPALRDRLALAMGDDRINWLSERPVHWISGNLAVTHAGPDPARPISAQRSTLLWGHPDCGRVPRRDGLWVAQGHVIVDAPQVTPGHIMVDTGAYAGGPLTAAVLGDGPPRFISTA